jgi:glycosyltransferase involved in cell wall biosynthesis
MDMKPVASVCIATHNKAPVLARVLESIFRQGQPIEVIVCDDSSADETPTLSYEYPITYLRINRGPGYRNPAVPRNLAMKAATADILILQSDDVVHIGTTIEPLLSINPNRFNIATVWNIDPSNGHVLRQFTGHAHPLPLFFLGSVWRHHAYAVGGNDEEFVLPGGEDNWFSRCLERHLGLSAEFRADVIGHHQEHARPANLHSEIYAVTIPQFHAKCSAAEHGHGPWTAASGPWPL